MDEDKIQAQRRDYDENATRQRAAILGVQYLDTRPIESNANLVQGLLSNEEMYRGHIIPLLSGTDENPYQFGITTQTPQSLVRQMQQQYSDDGKSIEFVMISGSGFKAFMHRFDPPKEVIYDDIQIAQEGDSSTIAAVSSTLNSVSTDRVFDFLLDQADKLGASDIHIENERDKIRIRMRVDGALHPVADLEKDRYRVIMGALGSRANISSAATGPQSGHMQQEITRDGATHTLNLRVETIPTMYGQDAVLRLFNFDESLLNLDRLDIPPKERAVIDEIISHPRGMVLVVGPTGSGKSTTLYSILNALNTSDKKILTLEDPIEYGLTGITQIPIDTTDGDSFADALRSVLRLDPDIVMVGEIGGESELEAASYIQASIAKPVYSYIAGHTAPKGVQLGHAGAIMSSADESAAAKTSALQRAGAHIYTSITDLITAVK